MKEATRNALVGGFVVTALGALATLMVWFGEAPSWLGSAEWALRINGVRDLSGIGEGSSVQLNGIEIGRVKSLEFKNPQRPHRGVVIVCGIKREYTVPRGAVARVYGATLGLGTGHIELFVGPEAGLEPLATEDAEILGEMRSKLGELISKNMIDEVNRTINHIGNLTAEWTPVGTNLAKLLEERRVADLAEAGGDEAGANLTTVLERIDSLVAHLNTVLGDENVQGDVKSAVRDLKNATEELGKTVSVWTAESQKIADNINDGVDRTEMNLEQSFTGLNRVLEHLDEASKSVAQTVAAAAEGKGTVGLLAHDDRLYEAGVLSMQRLAETLATLQRILGKIEEDGYITVGQAPSGVLHKKFPLPTASADRP